VEDAKVSQAAVAGGAGVDDGTGAVLYAMFTSFSEVLGSLEGRLAAIEAAVRAGAALSARPAADDKSAEKLAAVERSVAELSALVRAQAAAPPAASTPAPAEGPAGDELAALAAMVRAQSELLDQRSAALAAAVDALQRLLQAHVDDTAHSLGRRAGAAGRRLAGDLGLRGRPKPPGL